MPGVTRTRVIIPKGRAKLTLAAVELLAVLDGGVLTVTVLLAVREMFTCGRGQAGLAERGAPAGLAGLLSEMKDKKPLGFLPAEREKNEKLV